MVVPASSHSEGGFECRLCCIPVRHVVRPPGDSVAENAIQTGARLTTRLASISSLEAAFQASQPRHAKLDPPLINV